MSNSYNGLSVVSLFSGIGGIELGLRSAGHSTKLFCEIDEAAQAVLKHQFPDVPLRSDITELKALPNCDLIAAGFPCQDLSLAGQKRGIKGKNSSLVEHLFRLIERKRSKPDWLLIENVPNMLKLDRGRAMKYLVGSLENLGYSWAYRVVDARAFGVPQRRHRVILIASRAEDPRSILFADDAERPFESEKPTEIEDGFVYGFYWTEGIRGVGWAIESVPPIKGGSGLGIPSPPAIWLPSEDFVGTPDIRDAERLQGFPENWTLPAVKAGHRESLRWKLVGNAVCSKVAAWVGRRLSNPGEFNEDYIVRPVGDTWPTAAWGRDGKAYVQTIGTWPEKSSAVRISKFLNHDMRQLSAKATAGFLSRASSEKCSVVYSDRFLASLRNHLSSIECNN